MARYRCSIDLGAFLGFRYLDLPIDGKTIRGIFIPTGINGIEVREDRRSKNPNLSGYRSFLNFQQRNYSNAFLSAARDRLVSQGETPNPYNLPAFQMCYTLPEDRRIAIRTNLKKVVIAQHPEWANMEDVKGNELAGAITRMMPYQIGDSYLMEELSQVAAPTTTYAPVTQAVAGYTPVTPPPADTEYSPIPEDLPF